MKNNFDITYLKRYVENQLTAEEDFEVGIAMQADPNLQMIVEGIEQFLETETTHPLEDFIKNSNAQLGEILSSYLDWSVDQRETLAPSEKSFKHWLFENKLFSKIPLAIVITLLSAVFITFFISKPLQIEIENPLKSVSYTHLTLPTIYSV